MYRTHTCGELRAKDIGQTVTLAGWVQTIRKFGSITFVDLRDRYGITQLLFGEELNDSLDDTPLGREFVVQATGAVTERSNKNPVLPTGEIEITVSAFRILNPSKTPPFTIQDDTDGGDDLRMRYRYLDLRRPVLQDNIALRFHVVRTVRQYLNNKGFFDIETPFLIKSTPEGARDFVVPSRMNPGQFYALPQSPQTFKQLLMVSGYDRYYQIVRCFRDEDLRADRQPEFTQIDCEMSFVEQEDILGLFEGMVKEVLQEVRGVAIEGAFPRMSWHEAMRDYGNDKPDIRFDMKLKELTSLAKGRGFRVFDEAELVVAIAVKGAAAYSRKQTDELTDWVKRPQIGMGGLAYIKWPEGGAPKSTFDKFFTPDQVAALAEGAGAGEGDLVLILSGPQEKTRKAMGELRLEMGERCGLRDKDIFRPLWIVDFPLLEFSEEDDRWVARHHPFTSPKPEHENLMDDTSRYGEIMANAYDIVLNGNEIGGGSMRIYRRDLQEKMFRALGMTAEEAFGKFGFLLGAFDYGAPPHGGIAFGLDRMCAILGGSETIRDFIAFPKNNAGRDVMLDAPSAVDGKQLEELHLAVVSK
jgi:aspartyl-tRNA synthetase